MCFLLWSENHQVHKEIGVKLCCCKSGLSANHSNFHIYIFLTLSFCSLSLSMNREPLTFMFYFHFCVLLPGSLFMNRKSSGSQRTWSQAMLRWSVLNGNHFNLHFFVSTFTFYEQWTLRFPKNLESSYVSVTCKFLSLSLSVSTFT